MRHKICFIVSLVFLLCILSPVITKAGENLYEKYGLETFDESNASEYISRFGVCFKENDTYVYSDNPKNLFSYLKEKYGDEKMPNGKNWRDVGSNLDGLDSISFSGALYLNNKLTHFMIENTVLNVLYLTQGERDNIVKYYDDIEIIALVFFLAYFFSGWTKKVQKRETSTEEFVKYILLSLATLLIISNAEHIVSFAFNCSNGLAKWMQNETSKSAISSNAINDVQNLINAAKAVDAEGMKDGVLILATNLFNGQFGQMTSVIVVIASCVLVYSRKLTFALRCLFLQMGVASLPDGGKKSNAMRYLKSMLADVIIASLYIFVISLSTWYQSTAASAETSAFTGLIMPIAMLLSLTAINTFSKEITKSMFS